MTLKNGNSDAESVEPTIYMDVRRLQRQSISFREPSDSRQAILFVAFGDQERDCSILPLIEKTGDLPIQRLNNERK